VPTPGSPPGACPLALGLPRPLARIIPPFCSTATASIHTASIHTASIHTISVTFRRPIRKSTWRAIDPGKRGTAGRCHSRSCVLGRLRQLAGLASVPRSPVSTWRSSSRLLDRHCGAAMQESINRVGSNAPKCLSFGTVEPSHTSDTRGINDVIIDLLRDQPAVEKSFASGLITTDRQSSSSCIGPHSVQADLLEQGRKAWIIA